MNILLVGGTGFIGQNLANKYIAEGHNVYVIGFPSGTENFEVFNINVCDTNQIINLIIDKDINHIIHLANSVLPTSSFEEFISSMQAIITPTIELIEYCSNKNIKFIFFSSGGTIYGEQNKCDETNNAMPTGFYGYSKQIIEDFLLMKQRAGMEILILRPSNPYGHGQNLYAKQGIIPVAIGKLLQDEQLDVYSPMTAKKDYIYIDDLVNITYQLSISESGIFNLGSGSIHSLEEILGLIELHTAKKFKINNCHIADNYIHEFELNIEKLKSTLVDYKFTSLEDGISQFIKEEFYEKN